MPIFIQNILMILFFELDQQYAVHIPIEKNPSDMLIQEIPCSCHEIDGFFLAKGNIIKRMEKAGPLNICDIPACVLYALGLPIPSDFDGKVAEDLFTKNFLEDNPVKIEEIDTSFNPDRKEELSEQDTEKMKKRLSDLGYI